MPKTKSPPWFCTECGYESTGYIGKCPSCGSWDSFKEAKFATSKKTQNKSSKQTFQIAELPQLQNLQNIPEQSTARFLSGSQELDRVLGGGIVMGSLTLLGGEPGIGKSTLLLQVANHCARQNTDKSKSKVLYISAEESSSQLKLRACRMHIESEILVLSDACLSNIIAYIESEEPQLVIIDSIQATFSDNVDSLPGSPSQIRDCASNLMRVAKSLNIPIVIVGHINKDGDIAGPKILEHMVDTVIQFEGSKDSNIRFLRSIKNRFGSTDEIGVFSMQEQGLKDLSNPSEIFLEEQSENAVVFPAKEGKRIILTEIQALVVATNYPNPRRVANGIETSRMHQIIAILEKNSKLKLSAADVYINVAGGLELKEPACDLAIAVAIYKSATGKQESGTLCIGELGLNGELRSVTGLEARIKEAIKLGFKNLIVPKRNFEKLSFDIGKHKVNLQAAKHINGIL